MKRFLLFVSMMLSVFFFGRKSHAQQTVQNGSSTTAINFPSNGCIYNWVNDNPQIGLAASGTGNIAPFIAINKSGAPVTATITATPMQSPGYACISNADGASVSVIDLSDEKVIATIPVGATPVYIAVSPDGNRAYTSNFYSNDISVLDIPVNFQKPTIKVGANPAGLVVSPGGTTLYVCNSTNLSVINIASMTITANIALGEYPNEVVLSPDGGTAYVTNNYLNTVSVINTATNKLTSTFSAGTDATAVTISLNGKSLYVANTYDNNISVFNTATNLLVTNIPVGTGPLALALSPDGKTLYVTNSGDNQTSTLAPGSVSVINTTTNKVTATIPLGGSTYPLGIAVTPDGSQVYVTNDIPNTVTIINTATNAISGSVGVGLQPNSLGNFMVKGPLCTGSPLTYTITVNPSSTVNLGPVTGSIISCLGSPSVSPNIEQFAVSGDNFAGNVTATAPTGFEVSLTPDNGYGNIVTLTPTDRVLNKAVIYVRSAASAPTPSISGNVVITFKEVVLSSENNYMNLDVAVTGVVTEPTPPSLTINASANNVCTGTAVTFTATPTNGGTSPVYQWLVNGRNAGTNSATFISSTLNNEDMVTCMMTSNAPCAAPASIASNAITVNVSTQVNVLSVSIVASDNSTCAGSPVTFTATPVNGGSMPTYQWQVNGNNAGTNSATFTSSALANGDMVTCMMTSAVTCSTPARVTSNEIVMSINALPLVNAGGNKTIAAGKGILLNATATGNITDITWTPTTGLSNYKILNPLASPSSTTTYTLTVQTVDGCIGSDMATVQVIYPIVIPNTFTPNGDGRNDTWDIKYLDTYSNCKVQIFNRWGQLLYSSTGYGIPWDGTYKGSAVPNGTYYYVIDLMKNSKPLAGFVMVLR